MKVRCLGCGKIAPNDGDSDEELLLACGWVYDNDEWWCSDICRDVYGELNSYIQNFRDNNA